MHLHILLFLFFPTPCLFPPSFSPLLFPLLISLSLCVCVCVSPLEEAHHCRCRQVISRPDGSLFQSNVSFVIISSEHLKALLIYRIGLS